MRTLSFAVIAAAAFSVASITPNLAQAFTPDSPEVKAMVERGLRYLETSPPAPGDAGFDEAGALWLVGIALVKNGKDESHPVVAAGVRRAQAMARQGAAPNGSIYGNGLAVVFLCEVDPVKYKAETKYFLDVLLKLQQAGGAWGYVGSTMGDTSQTQYAVLAMWAADHAGFDVPTDRIERVCHWLLRTQDVGGGFAYQPNDSGARAVQSGMTQSLSAAGLGSVYICGDLLGLHHAKEAVGDNDGLPPALKLVQEERREAAKKRRASKFDVGILRRGMGDGNAWFAKNYTIAPTAWPFYYMYALERCQSFRELAEGRNEKEPAWYNDGVMHLAKTQKAEGNWSGDHSDQVTTAFAILFLIRSTKKMIGTVVNSEGALAGGRGLPTDVTNVKMKGNQVIGVSTTKSIDDLISLLENPDDSALENAIAEGTKLALGADATTRAKQAERLRKIVSQENYQARILAVKTLAQARDLDNVPLLIYALGDPDWRVSKEARDGLKLISRRLDGFDMPDRATTAQRSSAQQSWKQWYLSIRPEAEFID